MPYFNCNMGGKAATSKGFVTITHNNSTSWACCVHINDEGTVTVTTSEQSYSDDNITVTGNAWSSSYGIKALVKKAGWYYYRTSGQNVWREFAEGETITTSSSGSLQLLYYDDLHNPTL